MKMTESRLKAFSKRIAGEFEKGQIRFPIHLSGGNERPLIEIFKKIKPEDYVFSTHRSHYHALLKGMSEAKLERLINEGKSMSVFDKELNFLSTSIVAGAPAIAVGVALALKMKNDKRKVWVFLGDGATDEGHFWEAMRYVDGWELPCTFIVEDNDLSVETPKNERYGDEKPKFGKCVLKYKYERTVPHTGTGKWISF